MDPNNFDDLTIFTILYNSENVIGNCLKSYSNDQKIIVVDNGSTDSSSNIVKNLCPKAEVLTNKRNIGYGPAVNQALSIVDTPYVLLINPDAYMELSDISILLKVAKSDPNAGIVAPGMGWELHLKGPKGAIYGTRMPAPEGLFCTWFSSGAIWLLRASAWREIGGFDESIFLYNEDFDFWLRLREAGKSIIVCPDSRAMHIESGSTPSTPEIRWRKEWNLIWGFLYVTRKHFGSTKTRSEIIRLGFKYLPKMIFHGLVFERKRFRRDLAIVHAIISFILGRQPKK